MDRIEWLIKSGFHWLNRSAEGPLAKRSELSPWQSELLRAQVDLRRRSAGRFPDPSLWLWTARSLAQSSDWWCAQFKATIYPQNELVVDGCCGAGVDLVALSLRGAALGLDRDPELVQLANSNLAAHDLPASAILGNVPEDVPPKLAWLHIDPDRRSAAATSRRLRDADQFSPSLSESLALARRARGAIIKLAPGTKLDVDVEGTFDDTSHGYQRWWLGNLGECRQQLLLTGELPGLASQLSARERTAVLCEPNANHLLRGLPQPTSGGRDKPLKYIYDCHPVLHASQLQLAWSESEAATALGTSQGYFTSDKLIESVWSQAFEVVEVLPWDKRRVKRWLRERQMGEVEVKKRLLRLDANEQQTLLRGKGENKITLMITRLGDRIRAIAARRISPGAFPGR